MSVHVTSWVLHHSDQTLGRRLVLLVLADRAEHDGTNAWPSVARIAHEARLSERQVQYALRGLEEDGAIVRRGRHRTRGQRHGTYSYDIIMSKDAETAPLAEPKGAILDTQRVQPTAPELSLEPSLVGEANASPTCAPSKNGHRPRPPDIVWDTLEAIFGVAPPKTNAHARRNKACADLRAFSATPDEIHRAHRAWPGLYENATCTDIALATHYAQLVQAKPTPGEQVRRLMAEKGIE